MLSLFPGAGLLDHGFTQAGFAVVRGPDLLLGQDIRTFTLAGIESRFDGIIGGPPCQDFSRARRQPPSGHGTAMLIEFRRLVTEAQPEWWLLENVPGVPTVSIAGYSHQRFNLFASDVGLHHRRNRSFQFGARSGPPLTISRVSESQLETAALPKLAEESRNLLSQSAAVSPTPLASTSVRKNFADYCEAMGLPRSFRLPGLSRRAMFRAIGNGVPVPMGYAVACAIRDRRVTQNDRPCPCDCGRRLTGRQQSASAACRKRMQRRRSHKPGSVTDSEKFFGADAQLLIGHVTPR